MRLLRNIHHWLGVFFAPTILLFAFSGALQTFSLHENKGGGPYKPPAWIVALASIHKDQTLPHPKAGHHADPDAHDEDHDAPAARDAHDADAQAPAAKPDADADHHEPGAPAAKPDADADHHEAGAPATKPDADANHHEAGAPAAKPDADADHVADAAPKAQRPSPLPLKIFVLLLSISLMFSTLLGLWIALKMRAMRRLTLILLAAGTVVPIVLLFL